MSERGRTTKTWGLRFAGFIDAINQGAINQGAINRRVGVYVSWLILAMTLISAANAVSRNAFSVSSNAFPEIQWVLFSALLLLALVCALHRKQHVRVDIRQSVNLRPSPNDSIPATRNGVPDRYENACATKPMLRRAYQSGKFFPCAQIRRYLIAEASFSNFMVGQRLPFR